MGRIKNDDLYNRDNPVSDLDKLIGSDSNNGYATKNFYIRDLRNFILDNTAASDNMFLVITGYDVTGQLLTVNPNWIWRINQELYTNTAPIGFNIPLAASGKQRTDLIQANTDLTEFDRKVGNEAVTPTNPTPDTGKLPAIYVTTSDTGIISVDVANVGVKYIEKEEKKAVAINATGVIDIDAFTVKAFFNFVGSVTEVHTLFTNTESKLYPNKKFTFKNSQPVDLTLVHESPSGLGNTMLSFPDGLNYILEPNEIVEFYYNPENNTLDFVGKTLGLTVMTNLGYVKFSNKGVVTSSTGSDATIPLADATFAGLESPEHYTMVEGIADADAAVLQAAMDYADSGDATTLASANAYADAGDTATLAAANAHSDANDAVTLAAANAYADAGDVATLTAANTYADAGDVSTLTAANAYSDVGDAATLVSANNHSDANDAVTLAAANAYSDAGDAATLTAANAYSDAGDAATLTSANAYADSLVTTIFRPAGSWDASGGTFPTTGTGSGGSIRVGDTYHVTVSGTPAGFEALDIGDSFYALIDSPAQVPANWMKFEANTAQSTESFRGTAKIATQVVVENEATTNDTDIVTPKKFWQGWTKGLTLTAFFNAVRGTVLTGFSSAVTWARVTASDTILSAYGKLQQSVNYLQSTRVTSGAGISIASGTTFNLQVEGEVVDPNTFLPTAVSVNATGVTATLIGSQAESYVWVDSTNTIIQSLTPPSPLIYDNIVGYWVLIHSNLTSISVTNSYPLYADGLGVVVQQILDYLGFNKYKGTNIVSTGTTGTRLTHSGGLVIKHGGGNLTKRPVFSLSGATDASFTHRNRNAGSETASTQTLDVDNIDVGGVTTLLNNNKFGVHKVWKFSSSLLRVQRGQYEYANITDAQIGIFRDVYINEGNAERNGIHIGWIVFKKGTSWGTGGTGTEGIDYMFLDAQGNNSASGFVSPTMQAAYDVSSQPQITTNSTKGAVDVQCGSAANTDAVVRIKNLAGTVMAYFTGNGDLWISGHTVDVNTRITTPQITITTAVSIDTTTLVSGLSQKGRNVVIANGANAINYTVNATDGFAASFTKHGSAAITFVQGAGRTLVQVDGTAVLNGAVGSTATISSVGTTDYLRISNV